MYDKDGNTYTSLEEIRNERKKGNKYKNCNLVGKKAMTSWVQDWQVQEIQISKVTQGPTRFRSNSTEEFFFVRGP